MCALNRVGIFLRRMIWGSWLWAEEENNTEIFQVSFSSWCLEGPSLPSLSSDFTLIFLLLLSFKPMFCTGRRQEIRRAAPHSLQVSRLSWICPQQAELSYVGDTIYPLSVSSGLPVRKWSSGDVEMPRSPGVSLPRTSVGFWCLWALHAAQMGHSELQMNQRRALGLVGTDSFVLEVLWKTGMRSEGLPIKLSKILGLVKETRSWNV